MIILIFWKKIIYQIKMVRKNQKKINIFLIQMRYQIKRQNLFLKKKKKKEKKIRILIQIQLIQKLKIYHLNQI